MNSFLLNMEGLVWKISFFFYNNPSIFSHYIEVWHFKSVYQIEKVKVLATNNLFTSGSYVFPFILQSVSTPVKKSKTDGAQDDGDRAQDEWDEAQDDWDGAHDDGDGGQDDGDGAGHPRELPKMITKLTVWKHSLNPLTIQQYMEIADADKYFNMPKGTFRMDETMYIGGVFVMTCAIPINVGGTSRRQCLAIRVVNEDGTLLRECLLPGYDPFSYVSWYCFEERLLVSVGESVFISSSDVTELRDPDSCAAMNFRKMEVLEDEDFLIRRLQATSVATVNLATGKFRLLLRTMDFWARVYPDPKREVDIRKKAWKKTIAETNGDDDILL